MKIQKSKTTACPEGLSPDAGDTPGPGSGPKRAAPMASKSSASHAPLHRTAAWPWCEQAWLVWTWVFRTYVSCFFVICSHLWVQFLLANFLSALPKTPASVHMVGRGGGGSPPLPGLTFPAALGDFVQDPAQALSRGRCLVFLALDGVSSRILGTGTYTPSSNWICIWRRSSPLNANIPQGSRLGVLMS